MDKEAILIKFKCSIKNRKNPVKGIILAGGSGTRLYPITQAISKQLLPIYDKPMIYYPLSVLMLAGIRDILIITTEQDQEQYIRLLGNGEQFGITLTYIIQKEPNGLAEAFILGESFIGDDDVALILGDNLFYGQGFTPILLKAIDNLKENRRATIFGYRVHDPERFGVIEFDKNRKVISLEEKPIKPKSSYAVTGLYFYPNNVILKAKKVERSLRGQLEITSINQMYLEEGALDVELLGRGFSWLDTGTHLSLLEASSFIHTIEYRQGLKVACLEEIGYLNNWIDQNTLIQKSRLLGKTGYGEYLYNLATGNLK